MCGLTRDSKFRPNYHSDQLSEAIEAWSIQNYNHLCCKYPWFTRKNFMLYVLDHVEKELHVIDPSPVPKWFEGNAFRKYGKTLQHFCKKYMDAMNVHIPGGMKIYTSGSSCLKMIYSR
ncbi:hypothetical protein PVAP13_4KG147700 [Panicum virgatum]|nr:hypothetical protein PVAP13_4KG147700 [Panicum virgatum]